MNIRKHHTCPLCFKEPTDQTHHIETKGSFPELATEPNNLIRVGNNCHPRWVHQQERRLYAFLIYELVATFDPLYPQWVQEQKKVSGLARQWLILRENVGLECLYVWVSEKNKKVDPAYCMEQINQLKGIEFS